MEFSLQFVSFYIFFLSYAFDAKSQWQAKEKKTQRPKKNIKETFYTWQKKKEAEKNENKKYLSLTYINIMSNKYVEYDSGK